jgi:hypothetical protein
MANLEIRKSSGNSWLKLDRNEMYIQICRLYTRPQKPSHPTLDTAVVINRYLEY